MMLKTITGRIVVGILLLGCLSAQAQYYNLQAFFKTNASLVNNWTTYSPSGSPTARGYHTAIWTGSKMMIWGGVNDSAVRINTGGIYDPVTNSWAVITTTGAPTARQGHQAVWTGTRMMIWGGVDGSTFYNTGAIYDPGLDSWSTITTTSAPTARADFTSAWSGTELLVWGGINTGTKNNTGGKYNPTTDTWSTITTTSAPVARDLMGSAWSGTEFIVWGGINGSATAESSGGRYNPSANAWTATSTGANLPSARSGFGNLQWSGSEFLVWGGIAAGVRTNTSAKYSPSGNSWTTVTTTGAPTAREAHTTTWTGNKLFVWGGYDGTSNLNSGAVFDGSSWTSLTTTNAPTARIGHTGVWTGTAVLVWGGNFQATTVHSFLMDGPGSQSLAVEKVYPTNGASFMAYIKGNNGGNNLFNQPDTACAGSETGSINACIHGGDKLKVQMTGYSSCSGMSITDNLAAFEWMCSVQSGNVTFYSPGFKIGKGISDIIDFTGSDFLDNDVTITLNSTTIGTSTSSKWWNTTINPIAAAPDSSGARQTITGNAAGTILTINNSANSRGYNINQNRVALVIRNGQTLTFTGTSNTCNDSTGETGSSNYKFLICMGSQNYLWFEGAFQDSGSNGLDTLFGVVSTKFSRFNKIVSLYGAINEAFMVTSSHYNRFTDITIQKPGGVWYAFAFNGSDYNWTQKLEITQTRTSSDYFPYIFLDSSSDRNIFNDVSLSQNISSGIYDQGNDTTFTKVRVTSSVEAIIALGNRSTYSHISNLLNESCFSAEGGGSQTINQMLCTNNYSNFFINGVNSVKVSQLALSLTNSYDVGIGISSSSNNFFTNNILIHSTVHASRCSVTGGTNPGMNNSSCGNQGSSNATWTYFAHAAPNSIMGAVTSNDVANASDSSGSATFGSITDWVNFDNDFRTWTKNSGVNRCTTGTCRIMDQRLKTADTLFRNKSNDGSTSNAAFTAGATCPAAAHGNKALADNQTSVNTFLVNAEEIINDGIGDDDGLCESGEACIYSPNFGAYQGEGDYRAAGTCYFQNGTVKDVTMYAYPTNGG